MAAERGLSGRGLEPTFPTEPNLADTVELELVELLWNLLVDQDLLD